MESISDPWCSKGSPKLSLESSRERVGSSIAITGVTAINFFLVPRTHRAAGS